MELLCLACVWLWHLRAVCVAGPGVTLSFCVCVCVLLGKLDAMKCGRDDISTARRETECGLSFHGNPNYEKDDVIQCYRKKKVPRKLMWDLGF